MFTVTERCLNIDMIDGVKQFDGLDTGSHTLKITNITKQRSANFNNQATGQSSVPFTTVTGQNPDEIQIVGVIGDLDDVAIAINSVTHNVNTLQNLFLVGSILTVTANTTNPEIATGTYWIVDSFTVRRNVKSIGKTTFELGLKRWYQDLP